MNEYADAVSALNKQEYTDLIIMMASALTWRRSSAAAMFSSRKSAERFRSACTPRPTLPLTTALFQPPEKLRCCFAGFVVPRHLLQDRS